MISKHDSALVVIIFETTADVHIQESTGLVLTYTYVRSLIIVSVITIRCLYHSGVYTNYPNTN